MSAPVSTATSNMEEPYRALLRAWGIQPLATPHGNAPIDIQDNDALRWDIDNLGTAPGHPDTSIVNFGCYEVASSEIWEKRKGAR